MRKQYSSFEEIDNDLKILKLKKEIDLLCVKSDYQSLLRNLSVRNILSDTISQVKENLFSKKGSLLRIGAEFLIRRFLR